MKATRAGLGPVCTSEPDHERGERDQSDMGRSLLRACCHAPKRRETMNRAFNGIALFLQGPVKGSHPRLVAATGNRGATSSARERAADRATPGRVLSPHALWPHCGTPSSDPLAFAFHPPMQLGTTPALTRASRLSMVLSPRCFSPSISPAASLCCCSASTTRGHTPALTHRDKRLAPVRHGPSCSGRSLHGAPVRTIHRMALRIWR
jgi:hypothetical protein